MAKRSPEPALLLSIEVLLYALCLVGLVFFTRDKVAAQQTDATSRSVLQQGIGQASREQHPAGLVLGRLEIARIGLSVPILEDFDAATLQRGVGHIPGTAFPGGLGNLGLVGHRDTFFRPLKHVAAGMSIQVVTPHGSFPYEVDSTEIVTPDRVDMLNIGDQPELTLVTCYPFDYIGSAPKRFIVHAHLVSM